MTFFPTAIDSFSPPAPTGPPRRAEDMDIVMACLGAIETYLGITSSSDPTSITYKINNVTLSPIQAINAQAGTTYTLVASDISKLITQNNAGAITTTVPQDSDVAWTVGCWCELYQLGAGQITVVAGAGATLRTTPTAKSRAQFSRLFLQKISANTWALGGDLAAI